MELLETADPDKKQLIEASDRYKKELQREIKSISNNTKVTIENALVIGGVLLGTYFLINHLVTGEKKEKTKLKNIYSSLKTAESNKQQEKTNMLAGLETKISSTASVLLLELVKKALNRFLKDRN